MVHPRMGQLLLEGTTDYPQPCAAPLVSTMSAATAQATLHAWQATPSPLGLLLSAVETVLAHQHTRLPRSPAPALRCAWCQRVPPERYSSIAFNMACAAQEPPPSGLDLASGNLQRIHSTLLAAEQTAQQVSARCNRAPVQTSSPWRSSARPVAYGLERIGRVGHSRRTTHRRRPFEMACARKELDQHLYELARECMLLAQDLPSAEQSALSPLWSALELPAPQHTAQATRPPTPESAPRVTDVLKNRGNNAAD